MIDDISKLYQKILEEQNSNNKNLQPIEENMSYHVENDTVLDSNNEEPFDNFLSKLGEKLQEEIRIIPDNISENLNEDVSEEIEYHKDTYVNELRKTDKPSNKKILKENEEITNIISEQIQEEIGKVKTQISRMAIEGGGGSVAVQYAKGGTMRGDLNVIGKYLSGGVDLSTLIGSGGGGGGLSGTTDRLISGSQVFKLNTDGTFNFPNNIITPQDETILTLESTKLLDNYYNRLSLTPYGFFASDHNENSITINSIDNEILIDSQNTYFWKFNNQGALEGPFGTLSVSGDLSASGRIYQNGNDLQSEIESISAISISTKTTLQSNSAFWNYQGSDIKALTADWVGGNAAYTTVQANSASWALDSTTDTGVRALTSNWQNTFTTVQSNSANWNYQGSDIKALTGDWQEAYTNLVTNSAAYLSSVDLSFLSVSTNWDSVYTTVLNESASWIGGGSTVGEYLPLSGGTMTGPISFMYPYGSRLDQGIYDSSRSGLSGISLVCSVNYDFNWQAGWITSLEQDRLTPMPLYIDSGAGTSLRVWNGNYIGDGTGTEITHTGITFADNTTQTTAFTGNTLSFDETTKDLSISNGNTVSLSALVDASGIDTDVRSLTSNWQNTFTTVQSNSSTWDYQGSDIKALTGGWVGGNSAYTTVQSYSATWGAGGGTGSDVSQLSGNWQSTYTTVSSNSAHWEEAYTTLQANSATWSLSTTSEILIAEVKNAEAIQLVRGDVVYAFGATGGTMSVKLASAATEAGSSKTIGIVNGTISAGGTGYITCVGRMENLNLGAFSEGDGLWLSTTPGDFTNVRPTQPNHGVYIGVVERANNGNGILYVKIQNGYELNEIHDVLINGVKAGDSLQRNNTNTLWINVPLSANTTYTTVNSNSAAWSAVTSYSSLIGNNLTNPLTATHNLNTKDIIFSVREVTTNKIIQAAGRTVDDNNLELTFNSIPTVNQYDLTVLCNGGIAGTSNGTTNVFALTTLSSTTNIQSVAYTHYLYNDSITSGQMTVYLLPPSNHIGVTQHKKIGSTANVVLSAPNGATIDGQPTYTLMNQYEAIGLYTDGTNYFIQ